MLLPLAWALSQVFLDKKDPSSVVMEALMKNDVMAVLCCPLAQVTWGQAHAPMRGSTHGVGMQSIEGTINVSVNSGLHGPNHVFPSR